jgi:hypothetical protein
MAPAREPLASSENIGAATFTIKNLSGKALSNETGLKRGLYLILALFSDASIPISQPQISFQVLFCSTGPVLFA